MPRRVFVMGYGNPSRGDDALGFRVAEALEADHQSGVDVEMDLQLNIEDAATASEYDAVVFVDAAASGGEPFEVRRLKPSPEIMFSSHVVSPETILAICQDSFDRTPEAYLLAIRGYEFDFSEDLSEAAARNLGEALAEARHLVARLAGREEGEENE